MDMRWLEQSHMISVRAGVDEVWGIPFPSLNSLLVLLLIGSVIQLWIVCKHQLYAALVNARWFVVSPQRGSKSLQLSAQCFRI